MGQSKQPATCAKCKVKGPPRPKAVKEGWMRRSFGGSTKPDWLCPGCGEEYRKERQTLDASRPARPHMSSGAALAFAAAGLSAARYPTIR